jgi:4-amino-4-deoxy-L-arabinose transferase-like glycosyltransferase
MASVLLAAVVSANPRIEVSGRFENQMAGVALSLFAGLAYPMLSGGVACSSRWAALGAAGACCMLTSAALAAPVGFCWLLAVWATWKQRLPLRTALIGLLAAALVLLPWTLRNWFVLGKPIILRSNFGLELAVSNHDSAQALETEQVKLKVYQKMHPYSSALERRRYMNSGEANYMAQRFSEATSWIRAHKKKFIQLCGERLFSFLFHTNPRGISNLLLVIVTIPALIGLALDWRACRRRAIFYGGIVVSFTLVYTMIQVSARYRLPIQWIFYLYTAHFLRASLRRVWRRVGQKGWPVSPTIYCGAASR